MFGTILAPVDGSALSERALPYAAAIARSGGGRLVLLRAVDALKGSAPPDEPNTAAELEALVERVRATGIAVEPHLYQLYHDDIGAVINGTAAKLRARLIVMSTHGWGGLGRFIYGSVADAVLREAETPVLLIPAACERPWPTHRTVRILVPLDGSDLASEALGPATELADAFGAELMLLTVVGPPTYGYAEGYAYAAIASEQELAATQADLEATAEQLRPAGGPVKALVRDGTAATTIAEVACEENVDLIVMATHGRGGLVRLVLGSVATTTLQRAGLPVLLVRPSPAVRPSIQPAVEHPAVATTSAGSTVTVSLTADQLALLERAELGA